MKNVNDTLAQRKAPWKTSARRMFCGGLALSDARRAPSIKTNVTVNKLELNREQNSHESVKLEQESDSRGNMTYENHISAELPSGLRVISAASSRATGRRVKLMPPMMAMMAYKAPSLCGLTAADNPN